MPILTVRHVTTYHYKQPVAFGEHRMMLRPRDDDDQKVLECELKITPEPSQLTWTRIASAITLRSPVSGTGPRSLASTAPFTSTTRQRTSTQPISMILPEPFRLPTLRAGDKSDLARFIASLSPQPKVDRWVTRFLRQDGTADTRELLVDLTQTINRNFKHVSRHEKGTRDPTKTLQLGSGSCRDLAMLMIAALHSLGIAARFVSGYLNLDDDDDDVTGGNTHAWVQVYVPGPGWIDFDPSSGVVGNQNLVRVAVVREPREAIPLQGTWVGTASDHLAMKVAVKVIAADAGAGRRRRRH